MKRQARAEADFEQPGPGRYSGSRHLVAEILVQPVDLDALFDLSVDCGDTTSIGPFSVFLREKGDGAFKRFD